MEKDANGRWMADGDAAAGMVVVRDPSSGRGSPRYVIDGWEVDADTYRLFLYDREIDTREQVAEILGTLDRVLAVMEATRSPAPPPAPRSAPAAPVIQRAPLPPNPPAPAAERTFDQPAPDTRRFDR